MCASYGRGERKKFVKITSEGRDNFFVCSTYYKMTTTFEKIL